MKNEYVLRNRVKELRSRLKMRQADLATEVDVTRQTILAIEKGRLNPSVKLSLKIARVLREPVDYIFFLDHGDEAAAIRSASVMREEALRKERELAVARNVFDYR